MQSDDPFGRLFYELIHAYYLDGMDEEYRGVRCIGIHISDVVEREVSYPRSLLSDRATRGGWRIRLHTETSKLTMYALGGAVWYDLVLVEEIPNSLVYMKMMLS
jgi:hypothetical protein